MILYRRNQLSIDIGTRTIKIIESRDQKNIEITGFNSMEYDSAYGDDNDAILAKVLSQLIRESGFKSRECVITLSGPGVMLRTVKSDFSLGNHEIPWNSIRESLPWEMDKYYMDYKPMGLLDKENSNLMVAAVPRKFCDRHINLVSYSGLNIRRIDIEPNAMFKLYKRYISKGREFDTAVLMINMGFRNTSVVISTQDSLLSYRNIVFGIEDLGMKDRNTRLDFFANNCLRMLDYHHMIHPRTYISEVLLTGGGSFTPKITEILNQALDLSVNTMGPLLIRSIAGLNSSADIYSNCLGALIEEV